MISIKYLLGSIIALMFILKFHESKALKQLNSKPKLWKINEIVKTIIK